MLAAEKGQQTIPTNAPRYGGNKYTATPEKFYRTKSGNAYIDREFRNKRDVWTIPTTFRLRTSRSL